MSAAAVFPAGATVRTANALLSAFLRSDDVKHGAAEDRRKKQYKQKICH